jgi:uncharacterized LabA/DUF88 family protein
MDVEDRKLALLIDADNISPIYVNIMLSEAKLYGTVSVRRIYGDWTSSGKNSWKSVMLDNSLTPIQQYSYTYGKNASDSAMIIDAMDILYAGHVDGFILASSDSDFTRLAMRLREAGKFVIGMGESKTPAPFVKSCDEFKVLDILLKNSLSEEEKRPVKSAKGYTGEDASGIDGSGNDSVGDYGGEAGNEPTPITKLSVIKKSMLDIIDKYSDENGQMHMSKLASMLTRLYSDFDARNYGKYGKFSNFVKALPEFEVTTQNTVSYVKRRDTEASDGDDASEQTNGDGNSLGMNAGRKAGTRKSRSSRSKSKGKASQKAQSQRAQIQKNQTQKAQVQKTTEGAAQTVKETTGKARSSKPHAKKTKGKNK